LTSRISFQFFSKERAKLAPRSVRVRQINLLHQPQKNCSVKSSASSAVTAALHREVRAISPAVTSPNEKPGCPQRGPGACHSHYFILARLLQQLLTIAVSAPKNILFCEPWAMAASFSSTRQLAARISRFPTLAQRYKNAEQEKRSG